MKLSRFLLIAVLATAFSVLYVWQQTEIIRLAYLSQKNNVRFQELLDKNSVLRYNLKRSTSLINIGNKILGSHDFQIPDTYCLVKLPAQKQVVSPALPRVSRGAQMFARFFGIKREAEAHTVENIVSPSPAGLKIYKER